MKFKHLAFVGLVFSIAASAFAQTKPEDVIKIRQASFRTIGWHCTQVKVNLDGKFNKDEVLASATVIQAIVNAGLGNYFVPGTEKGSGFHETATKPEAFDPAQAKKLGEIAGNFKKEANELAKVAATGDKEAVKVQFGNLTKTCKACHDDFRKS